MRSPLLTVSVALLAWTPAGAGELIFANGSRLAGELSNESLMVSTGSGLVEIAPDEVVALSREEVRLQDGRVIRGTLVGGQVKARTALGEIAVRVDELQAYRAGAQRGESGAEPAQAVASQPATPTTAPASLAPKSPVPVPASGGRGETAISGGLPTVAAYQDAPTARQGNRAPQVSVQPAVLTRDSASTLSNGMFEVLGESALYRDALFSSSRIGRVAAGQLVRFVDAIDRRLRILNLLVFDGGHWVKIRLADGVEGWVPAENVREVR
jgi:hypothetical protein